MTGYLLEATQMLLALLLAPGLVGLGALVQGAPAKPARRAALAALF